MTPAAVAFIALLMALRGRLRRVLCVLDGHYFHLKSEGDRLFLVCEVCAYESVGWSSGHEQYGRRLPGDPRRHQSYARRVA